MLLAGAAPLAAQPVEEVIITASPLTSAAIELAQSVAQIPREELFTTGGFGLGDALRNVPGVTSSSFAPGASRPIIRGFDAARVRVTENGIGSHDVSEFSGDHGVPIDPLASIEVEVLRGPGTLRYGSQAIGGVVNAINNRIPLDTAEGFGGDAFASIASNGTERIAGLLVDTRIGNLAFHADGIARGVDDYDTPPGQQHNSYAFGRGFAVGGAYVDGMNAAGLSFNRYVSHYGIPTAEEEHEEHEEEEHEEEEEHHHGPAHVDLEQNRYSAAARFTMPFGGIESFNLRGSYSDYTHEEITAGEEIEEVEATFDNEEWEARAEALHAGFGPIMSGAIGAQWNTRDFSAGGHGAEYLLPTETDSFALYAFERLGLGPQLTLELAGRIDWTSVSGETDALGSLDLDFTPLSFAGGLVFRPQEPLSISVNLSHTQRAPHVTELFAQGPHEASATFEIGDPTLERERSTSMEAMLHYDGMGGAHGTLGIFRSQFDGFIAGVLTGNSYDEEGTFFPDDSGEFAELLYLQEDAVFWGFEAQAHLPLFALAGGMAGINAQMDYVRAEFDSGGNVPRITPFRYGGGVFFERNGLELRVDALHTSSQDDIAAGETPTDGFTMLDASATFRALTLEAGAIDVSISGTNLLNETARNHVSFTKDHVLLHGRSLRVSMHYVF
jgi:iron complex outermembrane receptor protein